MVRAPKERWSRRQSETKATNEVYHLYRIRIQSSRVLGNRRQSWSANA